MPQTDVSGHGDRRTAAAPFAKRRRLQWPCDPLYGERRRHVVLDQRSHDRRRVRTCRPGALSGREERARPLGLDRSGRSVTCRCHDREDHRTHCVIGTGCNRSRDGACLPRWATRCGASISSRCGQIRAESRSCPSTAGDSTRSWSTITARAAAFHHRSGRGDGQLCDVLFIAVGTSSSDGSADCSTYSVRATSAGSTLAACSSTVPVGTAERVRRAIQAELDARGVSIRSMSSPTPGL